MDSGGPSNGPAGQEEVDLYGEIDCVAHVNIQGDVGWLKAPR